MSIEYVGCGAQTMIAKGKTVRVTFVKSWPYLDVDFPRWFKELYDNINGTTVGGFPLTPNNSNATPPITTVDVRVSVGQTAVTLYDKLDSLSWWHVSVSRLQLLSDQQGQQAASQGGAAERNEVDRQEEKKQEADSLSAWWKDMAAKLGTTVKVLLWVVVAVVVLVALVYAGKLRNTLKGG